LIQQHKRRTKVIWSFEAKCLTKELLNDVATQEFDALRLVYDSVGVPKIMEFLADLAKLPLPTPKPVMIDIATKVRATVTGFTEPVEYKFGDKVTFVAKPKDKHLQIKTAEWTKLFAEDASMFAGYGNVVFRIRKVAAESVETEVVQGGTMYPEMDIHVPDTAPDMQLKDIPRDELTALVKAGVDYIVVPGMASAQEITHLREFLSKQAPQTPPWIILKVNSERVYEQLDSLLGEVDGVLISRLEMALGLDPAMIPIVTKEIIQLCNDKAKMVFTASEMLGSMRRNATPTRAEVSDIANAVIDGTDAVVLSEEVPYGKHSSRALQLMRKAIEDIEEQGSGAPNWLKLSPSIENEMDAIAYTAYKTAMRLKPKAIVCITVAGNTAVRLATFRPPIPIVAVTFSQHVLRKLSLIRGVQGIYVDTDPSIDNVLPMVNDRLVRDSWLRQGDRIIFVSITLSSVGREASNLFTVQTLT